MIVEGVDIESQSKYHTPKPSTKDFSKEFSRFISLSKDWAAFLSQFWKVWRLRKVFSRIALIEMFSVFNEMLSVFSVVYPWSQGWKTFLNQFEIVLKLKTSFLSLKHTFSDCKWKNIHLLKQKYFVFDFLFILVWNGFGLIYLVQKVTNKIYKLLKNDFHLLFKTRISDFSY